MKLYREGTLLRDCLGKLWMITRVHRKTPTMLDYYDLVRLDRDGGRSQCSCRVAHLEYDFVSEA
jgi:hypothetical protein